MKTSYYRNINNDPVGTSFFYFTMNYGRLLNFVHLECKSLQRNIETEMKGLIGIRPSQQFTKNCLFNKYKNK